MPNANKFELLEEIRGDGAVRIQKGKVGSYLKYRVGRVYRDRQTDERKLSGYLQGRGDLEELYYTLRDYLERPEDHTED